MRFDDMMTDSDDWLAALEDDEQPAEEESVTVLPSVRIDLCVHELVLYEAQGKWGTAIRNEHNTLSRLSDAIYDAVYCIRNEWYAAKKGGEWYLLMRGRRFYDNPFPSLENLLDHLQQMDHTDAKEYAQSQRAIRPAEIVHRDPFLDALIFRDEDGWGVGSDRNKFLDEGEIIPVPEVRFDSDEFILIPPSYPGKASAVVGRNRDQWSVVCLADGNRIFHLCDAATLEEAQQAWRERPSFLRSDTREDMCSVGEQ